MVKVSGQPCYWKILHFKWQTKWSLCCKCQGWKKRLLVPQGYSSDQITWESRSGWHHNKYLGVKIPAEVSGTRCNAGIWMAAVTQTTDQVLPAHTGDWKTKGKRLLFNLVQLLLLGAPWCYAGPRVCRWRHAWPSRGSLVAAWHTLGAEWAAGITFTSPRPFTRSCSAVLSYEEELSVLFSVISGDYFYIACKTGMELYKDTLAITLQMSQHLRLSSQYNWKVIFFSRLQTKNMESVVSLIPVLHVLFLSSSGVHV